MSQEFSLPKRQATDRSTGLHERMELGVGTATVEASIHSLLGASPCVRCGVQGRGNLALTHGTLGFPTRSQSTFGGAKGFGQGAEKYEH